MVALHFFRSFARPLWLGVLTGRLLLPPVDGASTPSIFQVAPDPIGPGDAFVLIGDQLAGSDIRLYRLPDVEPTALLAGDGTAAAVEALAPGQLAASELVALKPGPAAASSLGALVPPSVPPGQYVLWTLAGALWSNPATVNRTDAYFVFPDRLNMAVDRRVRIIGRNLAFASGHQPMVALKNAEGRLIGVKLTVVEPYNLEFELPADFPAGDYTVLAHNGYGGAYGWSSPLSLEVVRQAPAGTLFRVTDYGASPQAADNQPAIQAAIDAAAAGGGVVLLPDGSFTIRKPLTLRSGVTLRGSGPDSRGNYPSQIKFYDDTAGILKKPNGSCLMRVEARTVLEGVRMTGSRSVDRGIVIAPGATDVVFRRNFIENFFPTYESKRHPNDKGFDSGILAYGNRGDRPAAISRLLIEENKFDGRASILLQNVHHCRIAGNLIFGRINTPVTYASVSCTIFENNVIDGRDVDGGDGAARGLTANISNRAIDHPGFGATERNYFARNLIQYVGTADSFRNNNGEYLNFDCLGGSDFENLHFFRSVSAGGADSVTVKNRRQTDGTATPWAKDQLLACRVMIVAGRGTGQMRSIAANTADTIAVTPAWTVPPDADSKILIVRFFDRNILYRNTARHNKGNNFMAWGLCTNTIMDGNLAAQGGSMIAGCEHPQRPDQFAGSYYNLVQNSRMPSGTIEYRMAGRRTTRNAFILLGNVYRDNLLTAKAGVFRNREDGGGGFNTVDNIFDRNRLPAPPAGMPNATRTWSVNNTVLSPAQLKTELTAAQQP